MFSLRPILVLLATTTLLAAPAASSHAGEPDSRSIRDRFESEQTSWREEEADTTIKLLAHERSPRAPHEGRSSERFQFEAVGAGSAFFYGYALPKVPITDDLRVSLFVRANRAGIQLFGRVILPADTDPDTGQPSFILVPGPIYDSSDRWQRLELISLRPSIERQVRVLRASTKRPVSLEGAYLERLVVNLFGGPGETEVFLDDLVVAPVPPGLIASPSRPPAGNRANPESATPKPEARVPAQVKLEGNHLRKGGYDWLFTAIQAPGADVAALRRAGFDVLAEDLDADPKRIREAIDRGFLLWPNLARPGRPESVEPDQVVASAAAYPFRDAVALWNLGDHLGTSIDLSVRKAEVESVRAMISGFRELSADGSHLTTATVAGEFPKYARAPQNLDIIAVRPHAWGTSLEPLDTYNYLKQRRDLTVRSNAGGLFVDWINAAAPPVYQDAIWGQDVPPAWGIPRVQPEQIRLSTYLALAAGYRGIGFRGDADLTRNAGRAALIEMAFLNEEIDLFESILANGADPIPLYRTDFPELKLLTPLVGLGNTRRAPRTKEAPPHPSIRAASIGTRDRKGFLLLVADYALAAQFQPPQMALNDLKITVPAPESAQAFEVSPGEVKVLDRERIPGGTRITIPDFGATALVLVTTDMALAKRVEESITRVRPLAVQLAIEQADLQLQWVTDINGRLIAGGHKLLNPNKLSATAQENDGTEADGTRKPSSESELLSKAEESIKSAREALEREDYPLAWAEARRAGRPLRILMRAHWQQAFDALVKVSTPKEDQQPDTIDPFNPPPPRKNPPVIVKPTSSPGCVAFNTLPQHYLWVDWIREKAFGRNLVPSGSFEDADTLVTAGWTDESYRSEGITAKVLNIQGGLKPSKRIIRMTVEASESRSLDTLAPFLDAPAAAIRSPAIHVGAKQLLRISVLVQRALPTTPGAGGIIIRDSIGGEPLQFRVTDPIPELSRVVLYRRPAEDCELTVLLGLAGYGEIYFDDFRIDRIEEPASHLARPLRRGRATDIPPPSTAARPDRRERPSR